MTKTILCLLALLAAPLLRAQTLYAVTNEKRIYQINEDFSVTYLSTASSTPYLIGDIAIAPDGKMYAMAYDTVYEINPATGAITYVTQFAPNGHFSLICSNDYELYTINSPLQTLYKYNLITHETTSVYLGFDTPGDITYYKGNLIFQTWNTDGTIYMVKAYNTETGTLVDIMCQPFYFQLWGLASLYNDCDSQTILASNPFNELYNIDFDTQTFTTQQITLPDSQQIYGLASTNEYLGSLCEAQTLGDLTCELSMANNIISEVAVYPNPATDVLHFTNPERISKVTIYDIAGKAVQAVSKDELSPVDISSLANGMYLVKIEGNNGSVMRKVIKR